ncbi:MAG: hypothetical protein GY868_07855 [Deltaproteobacteria bacterium]|nr:hypothetical protein [Deltaproteobacteria bacterium]
MNTFLNYFPQITSLLLLLDIISLGYFLLKMEQEKRQYEAAKQSCMPWNR